MELTFICSKNCVKGHSQIDKTKVLITTGSLMKVESIAECFIVPMSMPGFHCFDLGKAMAIYYAKHSVHYR